MKHCIVLTTTNSSVYKKAVKRWHADNSLINCDKCSYHHNPHYTGTGRLISENTAGAHHKRYGVRKKRKNWC